MTVIKHIDSDGDFYYFDDSTISLEKFSELSPTGKESYSHRIDGPAVVFNRPNKTYQYWFLDGVEHDFQNFLKWTPLSNEEKIALKLEYGDGYIIHK